MKYTLFFIALSLVSITGRPQEFINHRVEFVDSVQYDTVKVIAEVYKLPHKIQWGGHMEYEQRRDIWRVKEDSIWCWDDSTEVHSRKFIAWEVWKKVLKEQRRPILFNGQPTLDYETGQEWTRVGNPTYLAYNKKDTLMNVLQTWRPKDNAFFK